MMTKTEKYAAARKAFEGGKVMTNAEFKVAAAKLRKAFRALTK